MQPHHVLRHPTITIGEITTLDHERLNHSVECRAFVAEALLSSAQSTEVLCRFGYGLSIKADNHSA